ncbi:hypothetical protein VTK26DRAFT_763 [Humicola hyalothermophila]
MSVFTSSTVSQPTSSCDKIPEPNLLEASRFTEIPFCIARASTPRLVLWWGFSFRLRSRFAAVAPCCCWRSITPTAALLYYLSHLVATSGAPVCFFLSLFSSTLFFIFFFFFFFFLFFCPIFALPFRNRFCKQPSSSQPSHFANTVLGLLSMVRIVTPAQCRNAAMMFACSLQQHEFLRKNEWDQSR